MKKIFTTLFGIGFLCLHAQEIRIEDGLRYSLKDISGTARYNAMAGAFGALGADLSAINSNPAGSALFLNNYGSITGAVFNNNNKASYFSTSNDESRGSVNLNQLGAIFVFSNKSGNSDWSKISLGLNYESTRDFDNDLFISGTNPNNSIDQYFLNYANGISEFDLSSYGYQDFGFGGQQALLAYQTYLIDHNSASPNTYLSNVPTGGNYFHRYASTASGFTGKLTGNIAVSYKDKFYFGLNINSHFTDYTRTTSLFESNTNSPNLGIQSIYFDNEIYTYGSGFSFNLGAIAKLTNNFRIGLSYESPTWYNLNDELKQGMETFSTDGTTNYNDPYYPNVVNIYPTYKLQTPSTLTGSVAFVGTNGLISLDVMSKNYNNIEFRPKNDIVYQNLNIGINNNLQNTIEYRLGGEYKIKKWSLRAGYRFEESPYKNEQNMGELKALSGGLGYNFGKNRLDFAISHTQRDYNQYLISSGMNDTARINGKQNIFSLTYSVNF